MVNIDVILAERATTTAREGALAIASVEPSTGGRLRATALSGPLCMDSAHFVWLEAPLAMNSRPAIFCVYEVAPVDVGEYIGETISSAGGLGKLPSEARSLSPGLGPWTWSSLGAPSMLSIPGSNLVVLVLKWSTGQC